MISTTYTDDHGAEALARLSLQGLRAAPSQVWGSVRLVPLIREQVREDLRLGLRPNTHAYNEVVLSGTMQKPKATYTSYIPHGLILTFSGEGEEQAGEQVAWRSTLEKGEKQREKSLCGLGRMHRMIKREGRHQLRVLPMHLAIEGFLALHFGGPDIAYEYYSQRSLRHGLSPRVEYSLSGLAIPDLGEGLSRFEIHPGQCGVLIYVADALASAFVVPHPADYRALHHSVLSDMYAEIFWYYGQMYRGVPVFQLELDGARVEDMQSLREEFSRKRAQWATFEAEEMARDLIHRPLMREQRYHRKGFVLEQLMTDIRQPDEAVQHIGERIVRQDGTLEYLKTFRLSPQQVKKAQLLDLMARHEWNLHAAAAAWRWSPMRLKEEIVSTGFGYILRHGARTRFQ